jgi:hypothetical protein
MKKTTEQIQDLTSEQFISMLKNLFRGHYNTKSINKKSTSINTAKVVRSSPIMVKSKHTKKILAFSGVLVNANKSLKTKVIKLIKSARPNENKETS